MKTASIILALTLFAAPALRAQGTAFTYQGQLTDGGSPASGIYDLRFTIYDAVSAGTQQGSALTNTATAVSNGLFTVTLDFGNQFPGAARWLEIGVVTNGGGAFNTLVPRQPFTAVPYAIQSGSASNLLGVLPVAQLGTGTAAINITGSAASFTGNLSGHVTGPQAATVVSTVGGVTAANVALGANAANAATSANTVNAIVRRDAGGNFSAGSLTLAGNLNLPATTAGGGIIKASGVNLLHNFGSQNFFAGANAGNLTLSGFDNTAVGAFALRSTTSGSANTGSGASALGANTTGNHNTAHGAYALGSNTNGIRNTAVGAEALYANTSGSGNTANGMLALRFNTIGSDNTANGGQSLFSNTTGSYNTANGVDALYSNISGGANTASGYRALYSNTNGNNNTASGEGALQSNTSGSENTATGVGALSANTTGSENTADGFYALRFNSTGSGNTASGYHALHSNGSGTRNTADGAFALFVNEGGFHNTAIGYAALNDNTTGNNNVALGYSAGSAITTGSNNIALGVFAGAGNGSGNIHIGSSGSIFDNNIIRIGGNQTNTFIAGISGVTAAGGEVVFANGSGQLGTGPITAASLDPAIGVWTSSVGSVSRLSGGVGIGILTPSVSLHIAAAEPVMVLQDTGTGATQSGYLGFWNSASETAWVGFGTPGSPHFSVVNARSGGNIVLSPGASGGDVLLVPNSGNVGIGRTPIVSRLEVEGNASKTAAGSWLANSDARIKTGVRTVTGALDKLAQVRLVQFHYTDEYRAQHPSLEDRSYLNVVAQEFQKVFPEYVQSSGEKLPASGDAILQVDTYPLTIYSAAAIQELNRKLTAELSRRDEENAELKARLEKLERLVNTKNGGGK